MYLFNKPFSLRNRTASGGVGEEEEEEDRGYSMNDARTTATDYNKAHYFIQHLPDTTSSTDDEYNGMQLSNGPRPVIVKGTYKLIITHARTTFFLLIWDVCACLSNLIDQCFSPFFVCFFRCGASSSRILVCLLLARFVSFRYLLLLLLVMLKHFYTKMAS